MAERACLAVLFLWLAAAPLPFGGVVAWARPWLIGVPLSVCLVAALIRLYATRDRQNTAQPTRAWVIWGYGMLLFLAVVALQLIPLPIGLLQAISPDSATIWTRATRVATLAGAPGPSSFPISIDPRATTLELFRLAALFATFATFAMLVRTPLRRRLLATILCLTAIFEVAYGAREAALGRYAIWGWVNKLVFNRVTGTYVNPNHFAHYLGIVFPLALYSAAVIWRRAGDGEVPRLRRLVLVIENAPLRFGFSVLAAFVCIVGVLLSQSRGALLATGGGLLLVAAMIPGRRVTRVAFAAAGALSAVVALTLFLGPQRTVARFAGTAGDVEGRRVSIATGLRLWERFSILGTGAGTFEYAAPMEHRAEMEKLYNHAHNDYVEIGATTGTLGFTVAMVTLFGGYVTLKRMTFGAAAEGLSWTRRAFQAAALASVTIAMTHALVDFNFFIPANAVTLAAIAGTSVASIDHDKRTRR
jgi:putative inorganic carbon (hco3(-)) transporter